MLQNSLTFLEHSLF